MSSTRYAMLIVVLVVLAGCAGPGGGGAESPADGANGAQTGGDGGAMADGGTSDWCVAGQSMQMANPQTGDQQSWEVQGTVQEDGNQACLVVYQQSQGDVQRVEFYFTEDDSYQKLIYYDGDGNVVNEIRVSGGGSTGGGDGGTSQQVADDGADWCSSAESMTFTDPQTGEQISWNVQGVVQHDGRQACQAVWETNQGEVRRIEMYFTEDRSYQKLIYYDAAGNVVHEMQMGS